MCVQRIPHTVNFVKPVGAENVRSTAAHKSTCHSVILANDQCVIGLNMFQVSLSVVRLVDEVVRMHAAWKLGIFL